MALSSEEKAYIRDNTGDVNASAYKLTDATLQTIYDSTTQGNSDLDRTIYYALRRLVGIYAREVDSVTSPQTGFSIAMSKRFDNARKLLELWGGITGLGGSGVTMGHASTNTYRTDSLQTSEPTYERADEDDDV